MTSFDELIDAEPEGSERDRLRRVHDLLVDAGPPPEITPELASGPTLVMTFGRPRARRRRWLVIPAAAAAALVAVIVVASVHGHPNSAATALRGTAAAPNAVGTVALTGARTMRVAVQGLAAGRYGVYVVHNGHPTLRCGSFRVKNPAGETTAKLTSPYTLHGNDKWVVTRLDASGRPGATVLAPTA